MQVPVDRPVEVPVPRPVGVPVDVEVPVWIQPALSHHTMRIFPLSPCPFFMLFNAT